MSNWIWMVGGSRHETNDCGDALYFYTDNLLLCGRHSRGMPLQPYTSFDRESGFGKLGCPFCKNGPLVGRFSRLRSRSAITRALDEMMAKAALQPADSRQEVVHENVQTVAHRH